jgi:hypothetical protein
LKNVQVVFVTPGMAEQKQKAKDCAILWREADKAVRLAVEASTRESNGGITFLRAQVVVRKALQEAEARERD